MKNKILILLVVTLSLTGACAKKDSKPKLSGKLANLPSWIIDPNVSDGIAGVGIASPSKGGIKFQIPMAELDAKANIAATIKSEISRITKNSLRSANVNSADDVEEFFAQATKDVVKNLPLSNIKRTDLFQGEDGTLYIRMVLKNEDYEKFLKNGEKSLERKIKNSQLARENIDKSEKANKALFDELETERGNIKTQTRKELLDNNENN